MQQLTAYSRIIAGTMTWGQWGANYTTKEMINLMNHCVESGITTFDHADIYGGYTTEAAFGKAFKKSGLDRSKIQFISKCGIQFVCESRDNTIGHYQYNKEYIISSVEQSLKKLNTDYLDLLLLHRPSPLMDPFEVAEAIAQLKQDGKIKDFGVSNFMPSQIKMLSEFTEVMANQFACSLTMDDPMYDGSLDDCLSQNRMAMAWNPLGSYFKEDNEQNTRVKAVLNSFVEKYNATENQILLAWLLKHPAVIHPVIGTTNSERITDAYDSLKVELKLEDWFVLLKAAKGHNVP